MTHDDEAELEALRQAAWPNPEHADRGEVLMATGVGMGLLSVGVVALSAICLPCVIGAAPLAAASAPVLLGAGLFKRWHRRRLEQTATVRALLVAPTSPLNAGPEKTT
jgi:hypothetical protein